MPIIAYNIYYGCVTYCSCSQCKHYNQTGRSPLYPPPNAPHVFATGRLRFVLSAWPINAVILLTLRPCYSA